MLSYQDYATNQIQHGEQVSLAPKLIKSFDDDNTRRLDNTIAVLKKDYDNRQKTQKTLESTFQTKTQTFENLTKKTAQEQEDLNKQVQLMNQTNDRLHEINNNISKGREKLIIHAREIIIYKRQLGQIELEKNAILQIIQKNKEKLQQEKPVLTPLERRRTEKEQASSEVRLNEISLREEKASDRLTIEKQQQETLEKTIDEYNKITANMNFSRLDAEDVGIRLRKSLEADRIKLGQLRQELDLLNKESRQNAGTLAQIEEKINEVNRQRANYKPFIPKV